MNQDKYSRRRFLTDLLFVGGAVVAAAGMAATQAEAKTPSPSPTTSCPPQRPDQPPMPGRRLPPKPPKPTPTRSPGTGDNRPQVPLGGAPVPPPPK